MATPNGPEHSPSEEQELSVDQDATVQVNEIGEGMVVDQREQQVDTQVNVVGQAFIRIIKQVPSLYGDLRTFLKQHWTSALLFVGLQAAAFLAYYRLEGPYLIAADTYLALAASIAIALLAAATWFNRRRARAKNQVVTYSLLFAAGLGAVAATSVVASQAWRVTHPDRFDDNEFGIAVATFGDGYSFQTSKASYLISDQLMKKLTESIAGDDSLRSSVRSLRTGVVSGHEMAKANPHNAKLVIWGRLLRQGDDVDASFTVSQAPSLTDNPAYPQAVPLTERKLEFSIVFPYKACADPEAVIERQSVGIAAFSLGLAHFYARHFQWAVPEFEKAKDTLESIPEGCQPAEITYRSNIGLLHYYLGRSYQMIGDFTTSQEFLDQAAAVMPDDPALIYAQIYNYRVFGQNDKRRDAYRQLLRLSDNTADKYAIPAMYDRALAHEALEDYQAALDEYRDILAKDAQFFVAYLGAGRILSLLNRFADADAMFNEAEPLTEGNPTRQIWLLLNKGQLYERRSEAGDVERARSAYQQAVDLDVGNSVISLRFFLARLHDRLGDDQAARAEYERLIELTYLHNWAYSVYGDHLFAHGDHDGAISNYRKALRYPAFSNKILYTQLGKAYLKADPASHPDRVARLLEAFEDALNEPGQGDAFVHFEYAVALYSLGVEYRTQAIEHMERALHLEEDLAARNPVFAAKTRRNLAQMYHSAGRADEAIAMYASLVEHCDIVDSEIVSFALAQLKALGKDDVQCRLQPKG